MIHDEIHAIYTTCYVRLAAGRAAEAIAQLSLDLAALRRKCTSDEWRAMVQSGRRHPVHVCLLQDPYMSAAVHKPRGYAGDAHTLDFVYGYRRADEDVTELGRSLLEVSTDVPIARAVRARCRHVADMIRNVGARPEGAVILSIACGHMRELDDLGDVTDQLEIYGLDQDSQTLAALPALHPDVVVRSIHASIRAVIAGRATLPHADLIYASGLYDYLECGAAVALTKVLAAHLRPGGTLLIPNLTPANHEIACMEAVWDWWMVYRDLGDMASLAVQAGDTDALRASMYEIANGRVACLELCRPACSDTSHDELIAADASNA